MNGVNLQQKPWFSRAVDLFVNLHNEPVTDRCHFVNESITLTKQIQALAIRTFNADERAIQQLAEIAFDVVSGVPNSQKINALVGSDLFRLIVSTREPPKESIDHEYYKNDIVLKQLQGYSKMKQIDLGYIEKDQQVLNWICEANETLQTAEERHEMRVSMSKIPTDYYNQTQQKRIEIGKLVTTKALCKEIQDLLEGKEKLLYDS